MLGKDLGLGNPRKKSIYISMEHTLCHYAYKSSFHNLAVVDGGCTL